jgi:serine/threonine protein kinase
MLALKVPWKGKTEGQQLIEYFKTFGSPEEKVWNHWQERALYDTGLWSYLKDYRRDPGYWEQVWGMHKDDDLQDLLYRCFDMDDRTRITAEGVMGHEFFKKVLL